jgi:hypothetical protein
VPDPLSSKYPGHSPYNYVLNSPTNLIDPTGECPEDGSRGDANDGDGYCLEEIIVEADRLPINTNKDIDLILNLVKFQNDLRDRFASQEDRMNQQKANENEHAPEKEPISSIIAACAMVQFGITTVFGLASVASGAPVVPKPRLSTALGASSTQTSVASQYLSEALPQRLPNRVWAPTFANPSTTTKVLGRAAGRWVPLVGWGVLAYDAYKIYDCATDR